MCVNHFKNMVFDPLFHTTCHLRPLHPPFLHPPPDRGADREHVQLQEAREGPVRSRLGRRLEPIGVLVVLLRRDVQQRAAVRREHPEAGDGQEAGAQDQRPEEPGRRGSGTASGDRKSSINQNVTFYSYKSSKSQRFKSSVLVKQLFFSP